MYHHQYRAGPKAAKHWRNPERCGPVLYKGLLNYFLMCSGHSTPQSTVLLLFRRLDVNLMKLYQLTWRERWYYIPSLCQSQSSASRILAVGVNNNRLTCRTIPCAQWFSFYRLNKRTEKYRKKKRKAKQIQWTWHKSSRRKISQLLTCCMAAVRRSKVVYWTHCYIWTFHLPQA